MPAMSRRSLWLSSLPEDILSDFYLPMILKMTRVVKCSGLESRGLFIWLFSRLILEVAKRGKRGQR
jgi:hypothetical protein